MEYTRGSHADDPNDTEPCHCEEDIERAKERKEVLHELENAIFSSKEDDGVEHIDMSYKKFISKIRYLAG